MFSRVIAAGLAMVALAAVASAASPDSVGVRALVDNNKVRVRLLSFPAGYRGSSQLAPRAEQLIVYLNGVSSYPATIPVILQ